MGELTGWQETPLCGREEFDGLMRGLVADHAPRLFAVVQEYGDRVDGRVAAWGMAFDGHADVVGVSGGSLARLVVPENALRVYRRGTRITPSLVWVPEKPRA